MEMNELAGKVRGIWGLLALCVVAAVVAVGAGQALVGLIFLAFGVATMVFAALTGDHGSEEPDLGPTSMPTEGEPRAPFPVDREVGGPEPPRPAGASDLDLVIFKHLLVDRPSSIGSQGDLPAQFFVNLREAALVPSQRDVLVSTLADHIRSSDINIANWHIVAVPKSGNVPLVLALADELSLAPMLVRESPLNGQYIECGLNRGRVILVDDVASDSDLFVRVARHIRDAGFICTQAYLLIQRTEGGIFDEIGGDPTDVVPPIALSAALHMGDPEFRDLVARARVS